MAFERVITGVDYGLGVLYIAWVSAAFLLGRSGRRRPGPGPERWRRRMWRVGVAGGAFLLTVGLAACFIRPPAKAMDLLFWPGAVYVMTAWVMSIHRRRLAAGEGTSGPQQASPAMHESE